MDEKLKKIVSDIISDDIGKGLLIAVVIVILFACGYSFGAVTDTPDKEAAATQGTSTAQTVAATTAPTAAPTTQAPVVTPTTQAPTAAPEGETTVATTAAADVTPGAQEKTTGEIIALFNESANKVKTEAVKVVKNFENRTHNEEHLVLPSLVEGMAKDLMNEHFVDDTVPVEYLTKEDIVANYPVPEQSWSSQLTEAEVAEAACIDNGTEYEITLKLHSTLNPEPGVGTAKAFDCITTSEVTESAPAMIETFTTEYYDCVVKCKIDKATGRTVWSNYTSPVIINVVVNMGFTKVEARVGMTFEKDYSITY